MISSFKNNKKNANGISKLRINNTELTQTGDICNAFNKYFSSIGKELVANMDINNSPKKYILTFMRIVDSQ